MKGLEFVMVFLGSKKDISKKSGNEYAKAKFIEPESQYTFEFFVMDNQLMKDLEGIKLYLPTTVVLNIQARNGEAEVRLVGVKQK